MCCTKLLQVLNMFQPTKRQLALRWYLVKVILHKCFLRQRSPLPPVLFCSVSRIADSYICIHLLYRVMVLMFADVLLVQNLDKACQPPGATDGNVEMTRTMKKGRRRRDIRMVNCSSISFLIKSDQWRKKGGRLLRTARRRSRQNSLRLNLLKIIIIIQIFFDILPL